MGSPIPGSMAMPDTPEHFPIEVDAQGRGPVDPAETADVVCWCGQPGCQRFLGNLKDATVAFRTALGALKAQRSVSHLGEHCSASCFDQEGRKRPHA